MSFHRSPVLLWISKINGYVFLKTITLVYLSCVRAILAYPSDVILKLYSFVIWELFMKRSRQYSASGMAVKSDGGVTIWCEASRRGSLPPWNAGHACHFYLLMKHSLRFWCANRLRISSRFYFPKLFYISSGVVLSCLVVTQFVNNSLLLTEFYTRNVTNFHKFTLPIELSKCSLSST